MLNPPTSRRSINIPVLGRSHTMPYHYVSQPTSQFSFSTSTQLTLQTTTSLQNDTALVQDTTVAKRRSYPESNRGCRKILRRSESGVITATCGGLVIWIEEIWEDGVAYTIEPCCLVIG